MAVWELLGIEPTNDVTTIKRAYAKKLKVYHPEDDPEGYQKLREAYDYAVQLAKRKAAVEPEPEEIEETNWDSSYSYGEVEEAKEENAPVAEDQVEEGIRVAGDQTKENDIDDQLEEKVRASEEQTDEDNQIANGEILNQEGYESRETIETIYSPIDFNETYGDELDEDEDEDEDESYIALSRQVHLDWNDGYYNESIPVDKFLQRVDALYHDYESRISVEEWSELLNDDIIWNVQQKGVLSYTLLTYFQEHRYLPKRVWELLENCFHWQERLHEVEDDDSDGSIASFIQYIKRQLTEPELRYEFLKNAGNIDYDAFLYHREMASDALKKDDLDLAKHAIKQAYQIYSDDPDLLRLQGIFFLRTENPEGALASFSHAIRVHPDDLDGYFYRARILLDSLQLSKAIEECHTILERVPGNAEALNLLGKCYLMQGEKNKAEEIFSQVVAANPSDIEALVNLMPNRLLEKRSFRNKINLYWKLFPRFRVFIYIIFALIIFNLMSDSVVKHTGVSPAAYVSNILFNQGKSKEVFVDSSGELKAGSNLYRLEFERASFLGLYEYRIPDDNGEAAPFYASYLDLARNKNSVLTKSPSGWIYAGYVGDDKVVILIANAEQASALNKDPNIELTAQVHPVISEELPQLVNEMLEMQPGLAHLKEDPMMADMYLDGREQFIEQPIQGKIPVLVYIYALILIYFLRLVLKEFGKVYRAVRY